MRSAGRLLHSRSSRHRAPRPRPDGGLSPAPPPTTFAAARTTAGASPESRRSLPRSQPPRRRVSRSSPTALMSGRWMSSAAIARNACWSRPSSVPRRLPAPRSRRASMPAPGRRRPQALVAGVPPGSAMPADERLHPGRDSGATCSASAAECSSERARRWSSCAALPVKASIRLRLAPTEDSLRTTNAPIRPSAGTCVPPHSSIECSPARTTLTISPYLSPKNDMAPSARALSSVLSVVSTGSSLRMSAITSSSICARSSSLS